MPARFQTYGPFEIPRESNQVTRDSLASMWDHVAEQPSDLDLRRAIGIYIVANRSTDGELLPVYVGKTEKGFESRFKSHASGKKSFAKMCEVSPKGKLVVFFIALHTKGGKKLRRKATAPVRIIEKLEFMLIGSCLELNKALVNRSNRTIHRALEVPGYLRDAKSTRSQAAKQLASMLGT